jgi:hypothetical protein
MPFERVLLQRFIRDHEVRLLLSLKAAVSAATGLGSAGQTAGQAGDGRLA